MKNTTDQEYDITVRNYIKLNWVHRPTYAIGTLTIKCYITMGSLTHIGYTDPLIIKVHRPLSNNGFADPLVVLLL